MASTKIIVPGKRIKTTGYCKVCGALIFKLCHPDEEQIWWHEDIEKDNHKPREEK